MVNGATLSTGAYQTYYRVTATCQFSFVTAHLNLANPFTFTVSAAAANLAG